jgi:hypothetical protein
VGKKKVVSEVLPGSERFKYVLGLDMSLKHTGWCLANLASKARSNGLIEPGDKLKGMDRLNFLRQRVKNLALYGSVSGLASGEVTPIDAFLRQTPLVQAPIIDCLVLIEGYAFSAKGSSGISLGELGGVVRMALFDGNIKFVEVTPTQVKKFVTGAGNSPKNIMLKEMLRRFDEDLTDDNIADATALAYIGRMLVGDFLPTTDYQRKIQSDLIKANI